MHHFLKKKEVEQILKEIVLVVKTYYRPMYEVIATYTRDRNLEQLFTLSCYLFVLSCKSKEYLCDTFPQIEQYYCNMSIIF